MNIRELFPRTYQAMMDYGEDFVVKYREELQKQNAIASGDLFRKVRYEVIAGTELITLQLQLPEYGEYLEEGVNGIQRNQNSPYTRSHFPPREPILEWIQVKSIVPRRDDQGKLPTQQQLAFLIQRHIGLEGTPGKHMFANTLQETYDMWWAKIDEALTQDINSNITEILEAGLK